MFEIFIYGTDLNKVNFTGRIPVFIGGNFIQVESEEDGFTFYDPVSYGEAKN